MSRDTSFFMDGDILRNVLKKGKRLTSSRCVLHNNNYDLFPENVTPHDANIQKSHESLFRLSRTVTSCVTSRDYYVR